MLIRRLKSNSLSKPAPLVLSRTVLPDYDLKPGDAVKHHEHGLCSLDAIARPSYSKPVAFITDRHGAGLLAFLDTLEPAQRAVRRRGLLGVK